MDIDLAALRALERERDIWLDILIPAIEQALLVAYHRTDGAYRHARVELDRKTGHVIVWAREEVELPEPEEGERAPAPRARPRVRRHPHGLRPHRRLDRPPGHRAAAARPRGRGDPGRLQGPRGRRRRRHHPAEPGPAARPASTSARSRASCPWPSRCRARSTSTASGCAASSCSVAPGPKGPQIGLSRTHPNLVRKLFALEVPEIADGSVEIAALAREAGHRTKIAVHSKVPGAQRQGRLHRPDGRPRARRHDRAARREDRHRRLLRGPGRPSSPRPVALAGRVGRDRRPAAAGGPGHRARLPALPGHRQGGAERPPGRQAHRLAHRHPPRHRRPAGPPSRRLEPAERGAEAPVAHAVRRTR